MVHKMLVATREEDTVRILSACRELGITSVALDELCYGDGASEETRRRDLAALAAVLYLRRSEAGPQELPRQVLSNWHRVGRRLSAWEYGGLVHDPLASHP